MLAPWLDLPGADALMAGMSDAAGLDLIEHGTRSDADTIRDTAIAQPLITATSLLALAVLVSPEGTSPTLDGLDERLGAAGVAAVAGHSVGEFAAATASGVLTWQDSLALVAVRGRAMARAAGTTETGMAAVLGGDPNAVLETLASHELTAANMNGAGQVVAAGTLEQLQALIAAPPAGARVIPLQVAGAFHTGHMAPARTALAEAATAVVAKNPRLPLLSNAYGDVLDDGGAVVERLVSQVSNPVRWDLCQERLATLGVSAVIEAAPAGTLANLAKRTLAGVATYPLKAPGSITAARAALAQEVL